jgi:hypothetical protein
MAVLIGKGDVFAKLMGETALSAEAKKTLTEKYVCVSVNVDTEAGKTLAGQFQLSDGLVISSAGGTYQALRQSGAVTAADLAKHTTAYANAAGAPTRTVTVGAPVVSPSYYSYPSYQPVYPATGTPGATYPNTIVPSGGNAFPSVPYYYGCSNGRR